MRRKILSATSTVLPYAMMTSKYSYLRGVSSISLIRRMSAAKFDPVSLAQTESNMQIIKNLVALTASEIINPTLSQLATKKDLERVEGSLHQEIARVEVSLRQEITDVRKDLERVEGSLHQEIARVEGSLCREIDEKSKRADDKIDEGFKRMLTKEDFFRSREEDRREKEKSRRWAVGTGATLIIALYAAGFFNRQQQKTDHPKSDHMVQTSATQTGAENSSQNGFWPLSWFQKSP